MKRVLQWLVSRLRRSAPKDALQRPDDCNRTWGGKGSYTYFSRQD